MRHHTHTITGRRINILRLRHKDINLMDIAVRLSRLYRFNGWTVEPLTVAEHCVDVYRRVALMTPDIRIHRAALLHEAAEAYMCDLPTPIKYSDLGYGFRQLERRIDIKAARVFDYPYPFPKEVKIADDMAVKDEAKWGFPDMSRWPREFRQHQGRKVGRALWPNDARDCFLQACASIGLSTQGE